MHQAIEQTEHRTMAGWQKTNANPSADNHAKVMIDMQECDVSEFLCQYEENLEKVKCHRAAAAQRKEIN